MRDLEIRGAGEILGERQSGDLRSVGFAMYQKMVKQAARDISDSGGYADITVLVEAGGTGATTGGIHHIPQRTLALLPPLGGRRQ